MSIAICHHEGSYLIWSYITASPTVYDCTEQDVRDYFMQRYGEEGMRGIDGLLERARATGTSSMKHDSLRQMVLPNQAGPDGEEITFEDIIRFYFVEKKLPDRTEALPGSDQRD